MRQRGYRQGIGISPCKSELYSVAPIYVYTSRVQSYSKLCYCQGTCSAAGRCIVVVVVREKRIYPHGATLACRTLQKTMGHPPSSALPSYFTSLCTALRPRSCLIKSNFQGTRRGRLRQLVANCQRARGKRVPWVYYYLKSSKGSLFPYMYINLVKYKQFRAQQEGRPLIISPHRSLSLSINDHLACRFNVNRAHLMELLTNFLARSSSLNVYIMYSTL